MAKFSDIPKLTQSGSWECGFPLASVLKTLDEWRRDYNLDMDPDFQRLHVWTEAQQIAWVEYILRGGRTGLTIYLNCANWNLRRRPVEKQDGRMVLVDGKQRIEALRRFFAGEIAAYGSTVDQYEDEPDILRGGKILINVNDLPTRSDVLRWYIEMNAGGTPHTPDEIEKARALLGAIGEMENVSGTTESSEEGKNA